MIRWHDPSCRRPAVSVASGIPCCNYCFAIAIVEQETIVTDSSVPLNKSSHSSPWPSCLISGSQTISKRSTQHGESEFRTDSQESLFPTLPSEDHIRLVRLDAGRIDGLLHVDLEVVHIYNQPAQLFEILSYTSANESEGSDSSHIVFVGKYWDIVYVSYNCQQALRFCRNQDFDRLLWVDLLCIDQANLKEKSQQTSLRRELCLKASKVVAYLGEETSDGREALEFLKSMAITVQEMRTGHEHINEVNRRALRILLERPLFTRLWFLVEVLLARNLELVCGAQSAPWPKAPFALAHEDVPIPDWFFKGEKWYGLTDRDLLPILSQTSSYKCSDPRDKVFAVLSLISQSELDPDYTVSVEKIYIGLAAYLIAVCSSMDVLEFAGLNVKTFDVPCWVPDWSQALSTFSQVLSASDQDLNRKRNKLPGARHVLFHDYLAFKCESHLSVATPILRTCSIRICGLQGSIKRNRGYVHISMALDKRATLFVSFLDRGYEEGPDSLFLLGGCKSPVILREGSAPGSYLLVSACALSLGRPPSNWLLPWASSRVTQQISILRLSSEEKSLIREVHLVIEQTRRQSVALDDTIPVPFSSARDKVFSFSLCLFTGLPELDRQLWRTWEKFNTELGWMFRDQQATWLLLQLLNNLDAAEIQGQGQIKIDRCYEFLALKYSGVEYPSTYAWDLSRFVWSFLKRLDPEQATQKPQCTPTPILKIMMKSLLQIQQWAATTEQLLKIFEYTQTVLGSCWESFPGSHLPQKWVGNYENFNKAVGTDLHQNITDLRPSLDLSCHWDIQEFEDNARARDRLWDVELPPELEPTIDNNMAVHAGFRSLGLELYDERIIDIV